MLRLAEDWLWDFWLADDGRNYHAFFLVAPKTLEDPDLRHRHARIGHAVSPDLRSYKRLPDALGAGTQPGFDDVTTWTGSVLRGPDGTWQMYYTGVTGVARRSDPAGGGRRLRRSARVAQAPRQTVG